jgi:hypothetical protein
MVGRAEFLVDSFGSCPYKVGTLTGAPHARSVWVSPCWTRPSLSSVGRLPRQGNEIRAETQ